ncbi:1234_t:CDS:1, partial [Cetraspora pellucida]
FEPEHVRECSCRTEPEPVIKVQIRTELEHHFKNSSGSVRSLNQTQT